MVVPLRRLVDAVGNDSAGPATSAAQPGNFTVGVAQVELAIGITPRTILFTSETTNTGRIYIGLTGVKNDGSAHILWLDPGDSVELSYNDTTNALYAISDTAAQTLSIGALA